MVSFDINSLFSTVPHEFTIELTLERVYNKTELAINIARSEMEEVLLLCTKKVHFSCNQDIKIQKILLMWVSL